MKHDAVLHWPPSYTLSKECEQINAKEATTPLTSWARGACPGSASLMIPLSPSARIGGPGSAISMTPLSLSARIWGDLWKRLGTEPVGCPRLVPTETCHSPPSKLVLQPAGACGPPICFCPGTWVRGRGKLQTHHLKQSPLGETCRLQV